MNMNELELPKFSGRPLVETSIPMIGYLEGGFGRKFLEAYNSVVEGKYNGNEALKVLEFSDNVVKGSSTYSSIIAAGILRQSGLKLARLADIEFARKLHESDPNSGLDTRGYCYVDYGIVFRSVDRPNKYHAENLEPQIKKALGVKKIKCPVVILSADLDLVNDENGPNGLGIALRNGTEPFAAPALKKNARFNKTEENGMPIPEENGSRISYTIDSGLSGLDLDGRLALDSAWGDLALSASVGRVVAVKK